MPKPEFAFYLHKDPSKGGAVIWGGGAERLGFWAVQCYTWFCVFLLFLACSLFSFWVSKLDYTNPKKLGTLNRWLLHRQGLHNGEMMWFPIPEERYWSLSLQGFRLGGQEDVLDLPLNPNMLFPCFFYWVTRDLDSKPLNVKP